MVIGKDGVATIEKDGFAINNVASPASQGWMIDSSPGAQSIAGATVAEPDLKPSPLRSPSAEVLCKPDPRVAICTGGEIWGGVERFVVSLAVGLRQAGRGPLVLLFHEGPLAERLQSAGFCPVVVPSTGKYDIRQVARIREVLRSNGIDILHVHGYRATILGGLAALGTSTRIVRTEHGLLEPLDSWRGLAVHSKLALNQLLERVVARGTVDATAFVSDDIESARRTRPRTQSDRIIKNGLDADGLEARLRSPQLGFNVGIVGRITKVKGHEVLLDAMLHLRHLPDLRVHVFGTGPLQTRCEQRAREYGLEERVIFHGFCVDMAAQMLTLDALAIPSLHEGLPYTLLEALYLRLPVVASSVGGLKEVIEHGRNGLLVPPQDCRSLADGLERLYRDVSLRHRLGDAGNACVRESYLASRMVRDYLKLYEEVAAR